MPNPNHLRHPRIQSSAKPQNQLANELRRLLVKKPDGKVARTTFVGIGSELRGDDAVGVVIVNRLSAWQSSSDRSDSLSSFLFINGGCAPENILGEIKAFQPEIIVFIDAVIVGDSGEDGGDGARKAGSIRIIDTGREKISGISFCTHSLPLTIIANYIRQSISCEIFVIGIEPGDMDFRPDCALTPPVAEAAAEVVEAIVNL